VGNVRILVLRHRKRYAGVDANCLYFPSSHEKHSARNRKIRKIGLRSQRSLEKKLGFTAGGKPATSLQNGYKRNKKAGTSMGRGGIAWLE